MIAVIARVVLDMNRYMLLVPIAAFVFAFGGALSSCNESPKSYGSTFQEPGRVVALYLMPGSHETVRTDWFAGTPIAIEDRTRVEIPARYTTILECTHGRFPVDGRDLYYSVSAGDAVTLYMRPVYLQSTVVDVEFVHAVKVPKEDR